MVRTAELSLSNLETMGGSTPGGSWRRTVATRSRASWAAESMLRLRSKVAMNQGQDQHGGEEDSRTTSGRKNS